MRWGGVCAGRHSQAGKGCWWPQGPSGKQGATGNEAITSTWRRRFWTRSAAGTPGPGHAEGRRGGRHRGRHRGASGLTGGEHGGFTPNLLQLLNEQGIHLPLQGPCLPAGALGLAGGHLRAAGAAGVRGHRAATAAARTLPPGPPASARGCWGSPQRVRPGTGLLADGLVPGRGPRAGQLPRPQALGVLSSTGTHHTLHAGGGHPSGSGALGGTGGLPLGQTLPRRAPPHRRLTSGAAAALLLRGGGLQSGARAGGRHVTGLPLGAGVPRAQDQLWEGLATRLLALGRGAGRAPQEPLANGRPGQGPASSMTVQGAGLWASEEQAF